VHDRRGILLARKMDGMADMSHTNDDRTFMRLSEADMLSLRATHGHGAVLPHSARNNCPSDANDPSGSRRAHPAGGTVEWQDTDQK